jgi:hypothetical protein
MMDFLTRTGPLFDGRAEAAAEAATLDARGEVTKIAKQRVAALFGGSIRNSTGEFLASITDIDVSRTFTTGKYSMTVVVPDPVTTTAVTTDLATYGPWLEGVGSRNETTRFKGYQGFRRAAQELDHTAEPIAETAVLPYIVEMNA